MKILAPILSIFLLMPVLTIAQGEYDDLYYTPADRDSERKSYQMKLDNKKFTQPSMDNSLADNSYQIKSPSIYNDRINNTSQGRTVNPEYVAQYRTRSDARKQNSQQDNEVYYDEDYKTEYYKDTDDRGTVVNNYNYYGSGAMMASPYHDPFYSNRWRYNDWRMRAHHYDPFFDPFYDPFFMPHHRAGWAVNISFSYGRSYGGWYGNRWSRWSYDPWYSPYYGYHHYNSYWNRPAYYNNVVYINNNEHNYNSTIRRGPATSRGSVINSRRSVANEGPVRRVPVRRSSLDGDANGRVGAPSAVSSGRVIERSGVQTRSPRDYSNIQDRGRERSTIERSTVTPRNNRTNINRSNTPSRTSPQRNSVDRNDNRSNRTIDRSNTDQRRRNATPSRSETREDNNNRRYTPSRENRNNDSGRRYSAPQRNTTPQRSQPSYSPPQRSTPNFDRGGSSSRGSSMTPSRSTSSPSRGTSGRSSSGSSRRGNN